MNNKSEIPLAKKKSPIDRYWFEIHLYWEQNTVGLAIPSGRQMKKKHIYGNKLPIQPALQYALSSWNITRRSTWSTIALLPTRSYLSILHVVSLTGLSIFSWIEVNVWNFPTIVSQSGDLCHPVYLRATSAGSLVTRSYEEWPSPSDAQTWKYVDNTTLVEVIPKDGVSRTQSAVDSVVRWSRSNKL